MHISASSLVVLISLALPSLANPGLGRFSRLQISYLDGPLNHARQSTGVQALTTDISMISKNLASANDTVVGFKGGGLKGIVGLTKINSAVVNLGDSLTETTKTAGSTTRLSVTDS